MIEKSGTLLDRVRGVSTKIRGIGNYLISSLALAGTLAYSSPTFAQEQPKEQPPVAQPEKKKEEPQLPESRPPIPKPKPKSKVEEPEEKIKFADKEPESFLSWHVRGGASPNGDSQGSLGFSDIKFSLKDMFKGEIFAAYSSSSFIDENGVRTVINNPFNTKIDFDVNYKDIRAVLGFRGSLEETIRRNSSFSSTAIGTSTVEVSTRTKTVDTLEHYGGLLEVDYGGLVVSLRPYLLLFPTVNEHEIKQKVIDPNPAASYESNFRFRDPTPRNKKTGVLLRAGHTKELKESFYLITDLVGIVEQETLEFPGAEKREIQRIHIGLDAFLDIPVIAPRLAIFKGFLDDRTGGNRYAHGSNSTKFLGSLYFDGKAVTLKEKKTKSDDPRIDEIVEKTNIPALFGGTFLYDRQYGGGDRYTRRSGSAVLGFGNASGREALGSLASIEEDIALKLLGLRPEEGSVLSRAHANWQAYQRPFRIAAKDTFGLLLTGRYTTERLNSKNNNFYEGQAYVLLDLLLLNGGFSYNRDTKEKSWNAGVGYSVKPGFLLAAEYKETKTKDERIGTYSAGAKVFLK